MTEIYIYGQSHTVWTCLDCGCVSTCPTALYNQQRKVGGYHSCPNGHKWGWNKDSSEDEQIRRERDRLKQQLARKDDEIAAERRMRETAQKAAATQKGNVTKLRKRAAAGVCPCCHRTVGQMARHMATKHPGFKAEEVA